jgi:hypothetical protein
MRWPGVEIGWAIKFGDQLVRMHLIYSSITAVNVHVTSVFNGEPGARSYYSC